MRTDVETSTLERNALKSLGLLRSGNFSRLARLNPHHSLNETGTTDEDAVDRKLQFGVLYVRRISQIFQFGRIFGQSL